MPGIRLKQMQKPKPPPVPEVEMLDVPYEDTVTLGLNYLLQINEIEEKFEMHQIDTASEGHDNETSRNPANKPPPKIELPKMQKHCVLDGMDAEKLNLSDNSFLLKKKPPEAALPA